MNNNTTTSLSQLNAYVIYMKWANYTFCNYKLKSQVGIVNTTSKALLSLIYVKRCGFDNWEKLMPCEEQYGTKFSHRMWEPIPIGRYTIYWNWWEQTLTWMIVINLKWGTIVPHMPINFVLHMALQKKSSNTIPP